MEIKNGSFVVFKNPTPEEMFNGEPLRYMVTEVNGDRCFIEPVTINLHITPVTLALVADLMDVNEL